MYNECEQNKDLLTWIKDYDIDSISKNKIDLTEDKKAILDHVYKNSKNIRKFFFNNYLTGISNNLNVRSDKNSYQYMNFFGNINNKNKNKTTISIDLQSEDKSKANVDNQYSNSKLFINKTYEEYKVNKTINLEGENDLSSCNLKNFENNNTNINFKNNYMERNNDENQKIDNRKNSQKINVQSIYHDNNINYNNFYQDNFKNNKFKKRSNIKCGLRYNDKFIKNNELSQEEDEENKKNMSINNNKRKKIVIKDKSNKNKNKSYYFKYYNGNDNKVIDNRDIEKYESKIKILLKKHKSHKVTNKISHLKSKDNTMKNINKKNNNESNQKIKVSQNNKKKDIHYNDGEGKREIEYKDDKDNVEENIQRNIDEKNINDNKLNLGIKEIINPNNNNGLYNKEYFKKRKMYILKKETENNNNFNIDISNKIKNIDDNIKRKQIYDENCTKISQENKNDLNQEDIIKEKNINNKIIIVNYQKKNIILEINKGNHIKNKNSKNNDKNKNKYWFNSMIKILQKEIKK